MYSSDLKWDSRSLTLISSGPYKYILENEGVTFMVENLTKCGIEPRWAAKIIFDRHLIVSYGSSAHEAMKNCDTSAEQCARMLAPWI
jgi:hypothetical protein